MNEAFSWAEFFHMGGYAFFVWWSYGITFLVLLLNIIMPLLQRRKIAARIRRAIRREALEREAANQP